MRFLILLILLFMCAQPPLQGQQTIVPSAATDTFDLDCYKCSTTVVDMALVRGHQNMPLNLQTPVKENLLHWRYYDDIVKEYVLMDSEPSWTQATQLIEGLSDDAPLSLHVNLVMEDSAGSRHQIFLLLTGVNKKHFKTMPLSVSYGEDLTEILSFDAIVQPPQKDNKKEAYNCMEGTCELTRFDLRKGLISGSFELIGNKIGLNKKTYFLNGKFKN